MEGIIYLIVIVLINAFLKSKKRKKANDQTVSKVDRTLFEQPQAPAKRPKRRTAMQEFMDLLTKELGLEVEEDKGKIDKGDYIDAELEFDELLLERDLPSQDYDLEYVKASSILNGHDSPPIHSTTASSQYDKEQRWKRVEEKRTARLKEQGIYVEEIAEDFIDDTLKKRKFSSVISSESLKEDLVRGIIFSEILSPPKALRKN